MEKHSRMIQYLDRVQGLLKEFPTFTIQQVPRVENTYAYALASRASALDTQLRHFISVEHLDRPSIEEIEQVNSMQIDEDPSYIEVGSVDHNFEQKKLNPDLLERERERAIVRVASYQQRLKSYYDKVRQFQPGNLVLEKTFITVQSKGSKKMKPNWECPYVFS
ncbi:hypothetical protein L3X38_025763 [Prunus dulcis]|uniref:RNase H type-1 domain-containing protein n=1 Tax=Prunus dulcis TaxID=3755 RepID=A0AAD4W2A8_PRUDU|nr:hypothetical protein L3X38_025763 [Prunus dulcis]